MTDPNMQTGQPLLRSEDRSHLRQRWNEIEEWFVNDPIDAVQRADTLIDDAIDRVRVRLADGRTRLRNRWGTLDDATTEQLRAALHDYELLLTQLADVAAPAGFHGEERSGRPTAHGRPTFPSSGDNADDGPGSDQSHIEKGARP